MTPVEVQFTTWFPPTVFPRAISRPVMLAGLTQEKIGEVTGEFPFTHTFEAARLVTGEGVGSVTSIALEQGEVDVSVFESTAVTLNEYVTVSAPVKESVAAELVKFFVVTGEPVQVPLG